MIQALVLSLFATTISLDGTSAAPSPYRSGWKLLTLALEVEPQPWLTIPYRDTAKSKGMLR